MKKSMIVLLLVFAISAFSANIFFASNPVPGVDVVVRKKPGGIVVFRGQSGRDGKFACKLDEGNYELQLSYDQMQGLFITDKNNTLNKVTYVFTLALDEKSISMLGVCEEKSMKKPFVIEKDFSKSTPQFIVLKGGGTISCTLTYEKFNEPKPVKMISNGNKF